MKENDIFGFRGIVYYDEISDKELETLEDLFDAIELEAEISSTMIDFEIEELEPASYKKMVSTLKKAAKLIKEGDGEIKCEVGNDENPDPRYEFFTIKEGKLWQQSAKVVRDKTPKAL
ncbi:MAG: hypothetical protein ACAI35_21620 [Candidatus Methylacidiphilales bacterium]|nr:hypothetical protein [Candidatus Methylacidiphilales bacterium]